MVLLRGRLGRCGRDRRCGCRRAARQARRRRESGTRPRRRVNGASARSPARRASTFRVWAPARRECRRADRRRDARRSSRDGDGFAGTLARGRRATTTCSSSTAAAALPDPCSRFQPEGIRGPSRVVELPPTARRGLVARRARHLRAPRRRLLARRGPSTASIPHLAGLRELGVTAIELMPVATFPGERGWGYDGVYLFAPHPAYGGPEGLAPARRRRAPRGPRRDPRRRLQPHRARLRGVTAFGPYLTDRIETFWGDGVDFSQAGVREWAIQNALQWVERLRDRRAAAGRDPRDPRRLAAPRARRARRARARARRARSSSPRRASTTTGRSRSGATTRSGRTTPPRAARAADRRARGLLRPYGSVADVARELERRPPEQPRRLRAEPRPGRQPRPRRPPPARALRVASAVVLFSAQTPLLFMGEEYGEPSPFQFFTDHIDPAIAEATREGRKREFAAYSAFAGEDVPDPQDRGDVPALEALAPRDAGHARPLPQAARAAA